METYPVGAAQYGADATASLGADPALDANLGNFGPPTNRTPELPRAEDYLASGLVGEAAEMFAAIIADSDSHRARMGLGHCEYMRRNLHEALAHFQSIARDNPDYPGVINDIGVVYYEMGLFDEAGQRFHEAATRDPEDAMPWRNLIDIALATEDFDAGAEYCDRYLGLVGDDAEVRDIRAGLTDAQS